jgi:hypothetical protein
MIRIASIASLLLACSGCTVVNTVTLPSEPGSPFFVTAGDISEPHDTLGIVQVTKSGVLLFGNLDVVGTDLEAGFNDVLIPKAKEMGGDGVVRVRYHMTQYTPWARVLGAIFFFAPLPSSVTITGQVVKMRAGASAPQVTEPVASVTQ